MSPRFLSIIIVSFFGLVSCGADNTVLGINRDEAAQKLRNGDITFILDSPPDTMGELARIHVSAPYYAGLLLKAQDTETDALLATKFPVQEAALFEAALDGKGRVQREAARELLRFILEWDAVSVRSFLDRLESKVRLKAQPAILTLRAACLYRLGRFAELVTLYRDTANLEAWDRAFILLSAFKSGSGDSEALSDFLLNQNSEASGEAALAQHWALGEIGDRLVDAIGSARVEAVAGHFSISRLAYGEGLVHFRKTLELEEGLFVQYPALLGDLGRAFLYGSAPAEGMDLFLDWNKRKDLDIPELRYRILYYMGRIQRQLGHYSQGSDYFAQAMDYAADPLQADVCIWYILSMSLQEQPGETASLISRWLPRWNQDGYFSDILDRLARYLVVKRRWNTLAEVFALLENRSDGGSIAKYAYILGRAVSEGLMPDAPKSAEEYFRIALNQGNASFYYRAMAASRLGVNTVPGLSDQSAVDQGSNATSDDLEFLLGFFEYGAAHLAFTYLQTDAERFSPEELRTLAAAFAKAERWGESIRVVSFYTDREHYGMNRRDMELYYPRAFGDLAESHARDADIPPELLFGLIRTESAFVPEIHSSAGAVGLTQLMSATAKDMAGRISRQGGPDYAEDGEIHLEDPAANIHLGAVYLRYLMDRTESPMLALLAYNGGIGRIRRWRNAEPKLPGDLFLETIEYNETREYARKVLAAAAAYGYLYYGMTMEEVIADIYR
ncbi:flagellar assembly lytic transglycosylase [Treponema primitia]|uniref:flagellar assembly lytic transglycosylase n=1 Tax=Treponema primitia TaxID=88058 RepID=UPI001E5742B9|nr:lytic transglycosylase domain-containing protein [Treponema primitia]